jgi:hypothetical protein
VEFKQYIINSEQGKSSGTSKFRERDDKAKAASAKGVGTIEENADNLISGRSERDRKVSAWDEGAAVYTAFSSSALRVRRPLVA